MLLKALLLAIIIYFIFKAVQNMIRAVRRDTGPASYIPPRAPYEAYRPPHEQKNREAARRRSHRRPGPDIEDAKWEDIR